jgi:hypothetical protein
VEPGEVDFAGYDARAAELFLRLHDGQTIRFPPMEPEIVRQSFETAYVFGEKAELSIGGPNAVDPEGRPIVNPQAPGHHAVYYFGHTENMLLGLDLYKADTLLGELAFGNAATNPALRGSIPGLRSLPELFPEKYADHLARDLLVDGDMRIFINSASVELARARGGNALEFVDTSFAVHFGQAGPAEAAFAGFLQSHFHDIALTEAGRPFARLIPWAQALAVFRWLKSNGIRIEAGELWPLTPSGALTPASVPFVESRTPNLRDIAAPLPTVFFGRSGPVRIVQADGRESRLTYAHGMVAGVQRFDGAELTVYRDRLDVPLAFRSGADRAAAFVPSPESGLLYATDVALPGGDGGNVQYRESSALFPASNAENVLTAAVLDFVKGDRAPAAPAKNRTLGVFLALAGGALAVLGFLALRGAGRRAGKANS